jgi:signal transduction histidine kinase
MTDRRGPGRLSLPDWARWWYGLVFVLAVATGAVVGELMLRAALARVGGGVTADQIDSAVAALRPRLGLLALGLGALGLVPITLAARRVARDVDGLTIAARKVAAGDATPIARSALVELDRLGLAIDELASYLGERRRAAEADQSHLEAVLQALPQGVALVGADDAVVYASPELVRLAGRRPQLLTELTPLPLQRLVRQARLEGGMLAEQLEHGSPPRRLAVNVSPIGDGGVLLLVTDITESRRLESMRRNFVADASHELKTPVASILASAETARLALTHRPEEVPRFVDQIEEAARRLARIVEDLLDLSRLEAAGPTATLVDLGQVVSDEVGRLAPRAAEAGVTFEVDSRPVSVIGDAAEFGLAVRNLFENAIRYTDPGGAVRVLVERRGERAQVVVTDTGTGIPKRDLPHVFERFYRVDSARSRATGGTGLGLAIVKHAVERSGGTVSVASELAVGSTFTIDLPAAQDGL